MLEFYVNFCFDVLWEVLQFGNRRRLTKLERVGRYFHCIIERHFPTKPFLRLELLLKLGFSFMCSFSKFFSHLNCILFSVIKTQRLLLELISFIFLSEKQMKYLSKIWHYFRHFFVSIKWWFITTPVLSQLLTSATYLTGA